MFLSNIGECIYLVSFLGVQEIYVLLHIDLVQPQKARQTLKPLNALSRSRSGTCQVSGFL